MRIVIVKKPIPAAELSEIAKEFYAPMIKGVVDIEKEIIAFGGEYHIDANQKLLEQGCEQKDIWGFNIYLDHPRESWIEYTSLINIRPQVNNRDMEVKDAGIRDQMKKIIDAKII